MELIFGFIAIFIAFAILRGASRAFRLKSRDASISQAVRMGVPRDFAFRMLYSDSGREMIDRMWDKMREKKLMEDVPISVVRAYVLSCIYVDAKRDGLLGEIVEMLDK